MPFEPPEELINSHRAEMSKKSGQREWFRIHQPDHMLPARCCRSTSSNRVPAPNRLWLPNIKLPVVNVYRGIGIEQLRADFVAATAPDWHFGERARRSA